MNETMMNPKLTISIPTWNRAEFLRENILSMLPGIQALPSGSIEIFISDNASTDETADFLAEISQKYSFVRYVRQTENMGANANFYTVLKEAKGEYVWLMGDDDHINPSSLSQILADIEKYQPGVMIGGTERDTQGKRVYLPKVQEHLLSDQRILMDYDGFVLAGKMSVLIFSKEALDSVLESGWKTIQAINTPWPHLIWLFKLLAKKYTILVLPYTTNYIVEKNRYNLLQCGVVRIELMFMDYTRMLQAVMHEFSQEMRMHLMRRIVAGRAAELCKILAYATYLNLYMATIQNACSALKVIPLWKNRLKFTALYLLPALSPIFVRKTLLQLVGRIKPRWEEYQDFLVFLKEVKIRKKTAGAREVFNKDYLNKAE
ncbi:MAG: glycosyltransferase family 2 protein [Legionellaceae bacterium]|nr:glycosyltransferase family 2 protein [Legionellaceae bacterium]MBP9774339.1 glycosyltransferase family 2 protein [Legionellaceae bacterium]